MNVWTTTGTDSSILNALPFHLNGVESFTDLIVPMLRSILVFFRVITIIWVAKDISKRTDSFFKYILALLCILIFTPFLGIFLYLATRPKETLKERLMRREALEVNIVECGNCKEINNINNDFCTWCGMTLKVKCRECSKKFPNCHGYCPYCGAPNIE